MAMLTASSSIPSVCFVFVYVNLGFKSVSLSTQDPELHSSMVMTTGWMAKQLEFNSQQRQQIFQFSSGSGPALGPTLPSGYQDPFHWGQSD